MHPLNNMSQMERMLGSCLSVLVAKHGGELTVTEDEMITYGGKLVILVGDEEVTLRVAEEVIN